LSLRTEISGFRVQVSFFIGVAVQVNKTQIAFACTQEDPAETQMVDPAISISPDEQKDSCEAGPTNWTGNNRISISVAV